MLACADAPTPTTRLLQGCLCWKHCAPPKLRGWQERHLTMRSVSASNDMSAITSKRLYPFRVALLGTCGMSGAAADAAHAAAALEPGGGVCGVSGGASGAQWSVLLLTGIASAVLTPLTAKNVGARSGRHRCTSACASDHCWTPLIGQCVRGFQRVRCCLASAGMLCGDESGALCEGTNSLRVLPVIHSCTQWHACEQSMTESTYTCACTSTEMEAMRFTRACAACVQVHHHDVRTPWTR